MKLKNELDFLLNQADIGIYNKCEVIEIFGFDKKRKEAFNIYTLIVFENTKQNNKKELLTDKLQTFKGIKNISWGIQKRVIDISLSKKLYIELLEKNMFKIDEPLKIGKLKFLPKQYVAPEESNVAKPIQINKILKNNFHNGSYILEFFDEEKSNTKFLLDNPILLNKFSEQVSSILPIRIGTLSDRLGNVIFQFPINILEVYHKSIIDENRKDDRFKGFQIEIYPKSDTLNIQNLFIRTYEENETITRHKLKNVEDKITKIYLDDSFETYIEIINKENELLLYRFKVYLIKQGYISSNIVNSQKRVFTINNEIEEIEVSHNISNKDYIIGTIESDKIKISNINDLPNFHWEKHFFKEYEVGIKNLNFEKIYNFIFAIENGNRYRFNKYNSFFVYICYKYFFEDLVKIANNKYDMIEIIHLIVILNIEERLNLAIKSNNYLLKFEAIRKTVYFKSNNSYCLNLLKNEKKLLSGLIIQISNNKDIWKQFLNFYLEDPLRSIQLFEPMSIAILKIENSSFFELIKAIRINNHLDDNSKNALNSLILNIKDEKKQKYIIEKIFYRWLEFIDNYNEYLGSIILTDTIDIVILYIVNFLDKTEVKKKIEKILDNLDEINNIWFKDKAEQENFFYKKLSKLFVYSFALNKFELFEERQNILKLCENSLILKNEHNIYYGKMILNLFNKHIFNNKIKL